MIESLDKICMSLAELDKKMNEERRVYAAELKDRLNKGLTGEEAVKHYNKWMRKNDMEHLCVPE